LCTTVEALFPSHHMALTSPSSDVEGFKSELVILEKQEIGKRDGIGRVNEGGYWLFKIGWMNL